MARAAKTNTEAFEMPNFDTQQFADQFRTMAEKGMEQSREVYDKMKTQAEQAQKSMEVAFETAKNTQSEISLKAISAMRANADAGLNHMEALVGVKSVSEFIELQTGFFRAQTELATTQLKDMQELTTRATQELGKPVKEAMEKVVKEVKAA